MKSGKSSGILLLFGCALALALVVSPPPVKADPITVGFLYVGTKDDYGYNDEERGDESPDVHNEEEDEDSEEEDLF